MQNPFKYLFKTPRYLGMDLDPLHFPPLVKVLTRPTVLAPLFAAVAINVGIEKKNPAFLLPIEFAYIACSTAIDGRKRKMLRNSFSAGKAIDKQPDGRTMPTSPDDGLRAKRARDSSVVGMVISAASVSVTIYFFQKSKIEIPVSLIAVYVLNNVIDEAHVYHCYNKVVKGQWHIVKEPPKDRVLEPEKPVNTMLPVPSAA